MPLRGPRSHHKWTQQRLAGWRTDSWAVQWGRPPCSCSPGPPWDSDAFAAPPKFTQTPVSFIFLLMKNLGC